MNVNQPIQPEVVTNNLRSTPKNEPTDEADIRAKSTKVSSLDELQPGRALLVNAADSRLVYQVPSDQAVNFPWDENPLLLLYPLDLTKLESYEEYSMLFEQSVAFMAQYHYEPDQSVPDHAMVTEEFPPMPPTYFWDQLIQEFQEHKKKSFGDMKKSLKGLFGLRKRTEGSSSATNIPSLPSYDLPMNDVHSSLPALPTSGPRHPPPTILGTPKAGGARSSPRHHPPEPLISNGTSASGIRGLPLHRSMSANLSTKEMNKDLATGTSLKRYRGTSREMKTENYDRLKRPVRTEDVSYLRDHHRDRKDLPTESKSAPASRPISATERSHPSRPLGSTLTRSGRDRHSRDTSGPMAIINPRRVLSASSNAIETSIRERLRSDNPSSDGIRDRYAERGSDLVGRTSSRGDSSRPASSHSTRRHHGRDEVEEKKTSSVRKTDHRGDRISSKERKRSTSDLRRHDQPDTQSSRSGERQRSPGHSFDREHRSRHRRTRDRSSRDRSSRDRSSRDRSSRDRSSRDRHLKSSSNDTNREGEVERGRVRLDTGSRSASRSSGARINTLGHRDSHREDRKSTSSYDDKRIAPKDSTPVESTDDVRDATKQSPCLSARKNPFSSSSRIKPAPTDATMNSKVAQNDPTCKSKRIAPSCNERESLPSKLLVESEKGVTANESRTGDTRTNKTGDKWSSMNTSNTTSTASGAVLSKGADDVHSTPKRATFSVAKRNSFGPSPKVTQATEARVEGSQADKTALDREIVSASGPSKAPTAEIESTVTKSDHRKPDVYSASTSPKARQSNSTLSDSRRQRSLLGTDVRRARISANSPFKDAIGRHLKTSVSVAGSRTPVIAVTNGAMKSTLNEPTKMVKDVTIELPLRDSVEYPSSRVIAARGSFSAPIGHRKQHEGDDANKRNSPTVLKTENQRVAREGVKTKIEEPPLLRLDSSLPKGDSKNTSGTDRQVRSIVPKARPLGLYRPKESLKNSKGVKNQTEYASGSNGKERISVDSGHSETNVGAQHLKKHPTDSSLPKLTASPNSKSVVDKMNGHGNAVASSASLRPSNDPRKVVPSSPKSVKHANAVSEQKTFNTSNSGESTPRREVLQGGSLAGKGGSREMRLFRGLFSSKGTGGA